MNKKEIQWELAKIRELFIQRMTVDSDHHDRRRRDFNRAIFGLNPDGSTYQCFTGTDMDMVLKCWDDAVRDYLTDRKPGAKIDTPTREGFSHA